MKQSVHIIQDACEHYAVAIMQELAEKQNRAITNNSSFLYSEYEKYLTDRGIKHEDILSDQYIKNLMAHIPNFVEKLLNKESKLKINFRCIEKEARNKNLKGDFELELSNKKVVNFSLKNYNGGIRNMQYQSGTFNSFIMNLFFESSGVGSYIYPHSGAKKCIKKTCRITYNHEHFRGSNLNERDKALTKIGYEKIIPFAHKMDSIHEHMRNDVLRSNTYKFYDETKFNLLRKKTGHDGVDVAFQILSKIDVSIIRKNIISATGFIDGEELLAISPDEFLDTYTNQAFTKFRTKLAKDKVNISFKKQGQSLIIEADFEGEKLIQVNIPFTINSNGAWWRDEPFKGERYHPKEKINLKFGQLRPKKSREIATSINTYIKILDETIYS
jgi:hypothetical protein